MAEALSDACGASVVGMRAELLPILSAGLSAEGAWATMSTSTCPSGSG